MCVREMDNITANEIAGLSVGTLLLCATLAAPKIDAFISSSQRSSLGMCKRCGNVRLIACQSCKGVGSIKSGGFFGLNLPDGPYESARPGDKPESRPVPCTKCNSRGHFRCPDCSASSSS